MKAMYVSQILVHCKLHVEIKQKRTCDWFIFGYKLCHS